MVAIIFVKITKILLKHAHQSIPQIWMIFEEDLLVFFSKNQQNLHALLLYIQQALEFSFQLFSLFVMIDCFYFYILKICVEFYQLWTYLQYLYFLDLFPLLFIKKKQFTMVIMYFSNLFYQNARFLEDCSSYACLVYCLYHLKFRFITFSSCFSAQMFAFALISVRMKVLKIANKALFFLGVFFVMHQFK